MCLGGDVQFTDQSTGNVTSWSWTFAGGNPSVSSEQNPVVTYQNAGEWDVMLEVSDGSTTSSVSKTNYIKIQNEADVPEIPSGPTQVFTSQTNTSYYNTYSSNADQYIWEISPDNAGVIVAGDTLTQCKIYWNQALSNVLVELKVTAVNICGESDFSEPLQILLNWNTGINSASIKNDITLFPNPGKECIYVNAENLTAIADIYLYNSLGDLVQEVKINNGAEKIFILKRNGLPSGLYYLTVLTGNSVIEKKVIFSE